MIMKKLLLFIVIMLAISYVGISQSAPNAYNTRTWQTGGDGVWAHVGNWVEGSAPDMNSMVLFATGTIVNVTSVPDCDVDGLRVSKNATTGNGTFVTLNGSSDSRVIHVYGVNPANATNGDLAIQATCALHCNVSGARVNLIAEPGVTVWLRSNSPTTNGVLDVAMYWSCDHTNVPANIANWRNPSNANYERNKGLLLKCNATLRAEFIQEGVSNQHVHGWVESYMPYKNPTPFTGKENYHLLCPPVWTDELGGLPSVPDAIPCCLSVGDVLHESNDLNQFGSPLQAGGYMVRKWNSNAQDWFSWLGNVPSSCDASLDLATSLTAGSPSPGCYNGDGVEVYTLATTHQSYWSGDLWYGPLNNAPKYYNVANPGAPLYFSTPTHIGYQFYGNPFPSDVKLGDIGGGSHDGWQWPGEFQSWVWQWDGANWRTWEWENGNYNNFPAGYANPNYIAGGQGFFVYLKTMPASDELGIDNTARKFDPTNSGLDLKSGSVTPNTLALSLFSGTDITMMDQTKIRFYDNVGGTNYNDKYDCYKMFRGTESVGELYSKTQDGIDVCIKGYKTATGSVSVPVYFQVGNTGTYQLKASDMSSFSTRTAIQLIDKKLNTTQDLKVNDVYSFTATSGDDPYRFDVIFTDIMSGISNTTENPVKIYASQHSIYLVNNTNNDLRNADVTVSDILGRQLLQENLNQNVNAVTKLNLNCNSGYYIVCVRTGSNVVNQKIYIE